jgi:hypothetical protein
MNYQLIHDEIQLRRFIDFLPDLEPNEGYFLILIARKKWHPESEIPSALKLKRETVMNKSKIISVIRQWEVAEGIYQNDGIAIPQVNIGVYMGYNPKDQHKACFDLITQCLEVIRSDKQGINIKSMANDVIQSSNGTKHFIDIDVDVKEGEDYKEIAAFIRSVIAEEKLTFIKTNGGFHCLVRLDDLGKTWYNQIKAHTFKSDLNIMSNDLIPVVGCNQGKFVPHFM